MIYAGGHQIGYEVGYPVIYSSPDGGLTWDLLAALRAGGGSPRQMAFVPLWTLFAAVSESGPAYGPIYGGSWSEPGGFFGAISIAADDISQIYLGVLSTGYGNGGVWRSLTGGSTWEPAISGLYNLQVNVLSASASLGLYAGTLGGGVFKTVDRADYWQKVSSGIVAATVRGISCDPSGYVYATTTDFGLYRSTDRGDTWIHGSDGLNYAGMNFGPIATNPSGDVFISLEDGAKYIPNTYVYWSQDHGETWAPLKPTSFAGRVTAALACNSWYYLFVANGGQVHRTTDFGASWTSPTASQSGEISALGLTQGDTLYAGNVSGHILRSSDNGSTWSEISTVQNHTPIRTLSAFQPGIVFCGTDSGLFVSSTSGESWRRDPSFGASVTVNAVLQNPRGPIVAATGAGTYVSSDLGVTWERVYDTSPIRQTLSLGVDSAGYFYVGLQNGGILRSTSSTTGMHESADTFSKSFALAQNYPLPLQPNHDHSIRSAESLSLDSRRLQHARPEGGDACGR